MDAVCSKTNFLFCFASDALFIAGIKTVLATIVVTKMLHAKAVLRLLILKLNNTIRADTARTYP